MNYGAVIFLIVISILFFGIIIAAVMDAVNHSGNPDAPVTMEDWMEWNARLDENHRNLSHIERKDVHEDPART